MFTTQPTTPTVSGAIISYRDMLKKVITTSDDMDPKLIFQAFLREFIATNQNSFFAARLIRELNQPHTNVLSLLNDYFAGARVDTRSSFFAVLAAYFYYYADYYQTDCGLYSENEYPALMHQLILPLRLYQAHISQAFKEKFLFLTSPLDTSAENFVDQLNNIIACETPLAYHKQVYQNLLADLGHMPSNIAKILPFLCKLGIADEDKDFVLAAYIEQYSHTYLTPKKISFIFLNDADAISHLLNISLHEKVTVRDTVSRCLDNLYEKASPEQQIAIVEFWLKQVDRRDDEVYYASWRRLMSCRLPELMIDVVYTKLIESIRRCHSNSDHQLLNYLISYASKSESKNGFDDAHYQDFVDTLMLLEPFAHLSTKINLQRISKQQQNKLIPVYIDKMTNANSYSALVCLYNLPVDMPQWQTMVHAHFKFLQLNASGHLFKMPCTPRTDEQIRYATSYFLQKLRSHDINEVVTACAGIHYFQHPSLKESIMSQLWDLLHSPHAEVQLAAGKSLYYVKPENGIERFTNRLIQLIRMRHSAFDLSLSLKALTTETTRGEIVALFEELAVGPSQDGNAMLRLLEMKATLNKKLIPHVYSRSNYYAFNFDNRINDMGIPNELVEEVVKHILPLITGDENPPDLYGMKKVCELLIKLLPIHPSEKVILAITEKLNRYTLYELSCYAKILLNLLNQLEIPRSINLPMAKSMIKLMDKFLSHAAYFAEWSHCYNLIKPILSKIMQQASCAERCHILALLDSPDLSNIPLLSYLERLKATFIPPLLLKEEVRRKSELPYLPAEMWQQIRP